MNAKDDAGTSFTGEVAEISRLLTAIARRTYSTTSGEERRHDFGAVISIAVTAAAANLGGTEALLAGRPGSCGADYVRQIISSTTPESELNKYRTEPLLLLLDLDNVFEEGGLKDLYDQADSELCSLYSKGTAPGDNGENDAVVDARREALEAAYNAALDSYFTSYVEIIRHVAVEKGLTVSVEVKRVVDYPVEPSGDFLADELHLIARERTALPTSITSK